MSLPVAQAAGQVAGKTAGKAFRIGLKQVFLPAHRITFLAPGKTTPPNFATFKVPLTFNKFDIRDYLLHVYRTPVLAVRSQLRAQRVRKSKVHGRIYRPPPIKTMTVELAQPFGWPRVPTDFKPWRSATSKKIMESQKRQRQSEAGVQKTGYMPLRDEVKQDDARKSLKKEAQRLLKVGGWENKRQLDPRFSK
ncbi:hypothetical protein GGS20DRAFT_456818 [Poronia punctata]|nr:hypothetical protein GGS20DRAFT_456818 [Poronia punctata]